MLILPKERFTEMTDRINEIKMSYPIKKYELSNAFTKLEYWVEANSVSISENKLVEGKNYGMLTFSICSNAYGQHVGRWLPYHGDIYCELWRWNDNCKMFYNENAWGITNEKKLKAVHKPIIEIP